MKSSRHPGVIFSGIIREFGGPYLVEVLPGVSLGGVPTRSGLVVESNGTISVEFGAVLVFPNAIAFRVGDDSKSTFVFRKEQLASVKGGECGTVWWENLWPPETTQV